jgi:hypothetical protein
MGWSRLTEAQISPSFMPAFPKMQFERCGLRGMIGHFRFLQPGYEATAAPTKLKSQASLRKSAGETLREPAVISGTDSGTAVPEN